MGIGKITDLTAGVYRRQYAGFIRGRRINSVSLQAEAWFWRFHSAADDFGNAEADIAFTNTVGRRKGVTPQQVDGWLIDCTDVDLLRFYTVDDEKFYHVVGWVLRQPSGKNGKRVRRVPASPWDESDATEGESGLIQNNPDSSSASDSDSDSDSDSETTSAAIAVGDAAVETPFLVFPCAGRISTWPLLPSQISEYRDLFPGIDIERECKLAHRWILDHPRNKKTANGMPAYLTRWLGNNQNRSARNVAPIERSDDRTRRLLQEQK